MEHIFQKGWKQVTIVLLVFALLLLVPVQVQEIQAAKSYVINGVTVPLKGYANGSASYGKSNCRAFAGMVYKKIWGTTFTSYRGTSDDMLREVPTGAARAITAENVKKYISAAALGAALRITNDIRGNDVYGTNLHSQILIQKDAKGFTIYESIDTCVRIKYYTWEAYAKSYAKYQYFKYIKWPGAPVYDEKMEKAPEVSVFQMGIIGNYVTIKTDVKNASVYYTTDGSEPTEKSTLYEGIFTADAGAEIRAVVVKEKYKNSPVGKGSVSDMEISCDGKPELIQDVFTVVMPPAVPMQRILNKCEILVL